MTSLNVSDVTQMPLIRDALVTTPQAGLPCITKGSAV